MEVGGAAFITAAMVLAVVTQAPHRGRRSTRAAIPPDIRVITHPPVLALQALILMDHPPKATTARISRTAIMKPTR